jgi:DNA-binding NarL/FixJ family response regulator
MLKILLVEDHASFRRLISTELQRREEFQVIEAADGLEAIEKAEELQPDLILLDINLPKMNGFEVAKRVRGLAPAARVLFLSQESSPDIVRKALSLGVDGYVQKLSAGSDLLPAIAAAFAGRRFISRGVALPEPPDASAHPRHELLFCSDEDAAVDSLAGFVAAALNAADAAIVLVSESTRTELLHVLRTQGVEVDDAIRRGTCLTVDESVAVDLAGLLGVIDGVRAAAVEAGKPHPRIACCGERAGQLWAAGRTAEALQLEGLCRHLPNDVEVLCVYPAPYTGGDEMLRRVCAEHTTVSAC